MTTKWTYIPFFPGEPSRDPNEPPVAPNYEHLVGLCPRKVAILVSIYEGRAKIHLAFPEDSAEQFANAYADAYVGSSLGDPTDSNPFYCSAVEEVHHVNFRRTQNHDMPVRVYMHGLKGRSGWWSDPQPDRQDVEFRDVSAHLFEGVTTLERHAPRARVYLQFLYEFVGPMEERTSLRSLVGTPHKDRIRYLSEGKTWSWSDGWYQPVVPTSSAFAGSKAGVVVRPPPSPAQTDFRDIFTRRIANRSFYKAEPRAAVVTPTGDTASLDRVMDMLRSWGHQARYLGLDMADYDLWNPVVLEAPLLKGKEGERRWYEALDQAFENCEFYPHGGNPVDQRDLTLLECLVLQLISWGKRHWCLTYQPVHTGTTRSLTTGRLPAQEERTGPALRSQSVAKDSAPEATPPLRGPVPCRLGRNPKERVPVLLPADSIHTIALGGSGTGKTSVTEIVILYQLRNSRDAQVLFDLHGMATPSIIARLTPEEARRTLVIRPSRLLRGGKVAIGMNLLRIEDRELLDPNEIINACTVVQGDVAQIVASKEGNREMGDRIRRNLGMVVRALLHVPDKETTLHDAFIVTDQHGKTRERSELARMTTDQDAANYIAKELSTLDPGTLQSTQNKVTYFSHPFFRAALCQRGAGVVSMHQLLREFDLILINLEGQTIPLDMARYMGSAYLTLVWLAALRHSDERSELYDGRYLRVYVDEWPDMASESFNTILRGGRKRGLRLWLANQSLGDIPDGSGGQMNLLSAVEANVDTVITFRTDENTARFVNGRARLERFGLDYHHYLNWPKYHAGIAHENEYAEMITDPLPPEQPPSVQSEVSRIIEENMWRHAMDDTSGDSPLRVGKKDELDVLEVFALRGNMTRDEAILHAPAQHRSNVWLIVDNIERQGFLVTHKDPGRKDRFQVTELGLQELRKYGRTLPGGTPGSGKKMDGGDPHDTTLERARAYLQAEVLQVGPKIKQVVGKSNPDFKHTTDGGILVSDEVEDRASHPDQILRNYQKARGKPVWFWAVDLDTARRIVDALGDRQNYQVHVDQVTSFSRYGPGVPKEEEPISEEQDLVELSIVALIKEGRFVNVEGRRGFDFKDIVRSLPEPLAYQKVRSVLERMVGDTVYAIRERRPEQGGSLVILNDTPEEEPPVETSKSPTPVEAPPPAEMEENNGDVEMVFDTCVALSNAGKTFLHKDRGSRISLRFADVYDALPRPISPARFKEVVIILLQQDDISEVILRPNETAILVFDSPETGIVDNKMALEATPDELYKGLLPAAIAHEKCASKVTTPMSTPTGLPLNMAQGAPQNQVALSAGPVMEAKSPQPTSRNLMIQNLVAHANSLLAQGKALDIEGKKAVRVSDLCAFYPPWNETQVGQHLMLLGIPTSRPWIQAEKGKVTVWFAWG